MLSCCLAILTSSGWLTALCSSLPRLRRKSGSPLVLATVWVGALWLATAIANCPRAGLTCCRRACWMSTARMKCSFCRSADGIVAPVPRAAPVQIIGHGVIGRYECAAHVEFHVHRPRHTHLFHLLDGNPPHLPVGELPPVSTVIARITTVIG